MRDLRNAYHTGYLLRLSLPIFRLYFFSWPSSIPTPFSLTLPSLQGFVFNFVVGARGLISRANEADA